MKYIIVFLFFNISVFSQSKIIVPISGTIVFVKNEMVLDKDLYLKSYKELIPKMKKVASEQIVIERLLEGKTTDTLLLKSEVDKIANNMEMMLPYLLEEKKQIFKFYNDFNGDTITKYYTVDDNLFKSKIFINQITYQVTDEFNQYVDIEEYEIIKLTEYRNETKLINGYECFKIVYSYNKHVIDFDFFANITSNIRELWVTEEIKFNYHPVINESEILQKYYPLEIIEYSDDIKGFITAYKIETFNLN